MKCANYERTLADPEEERHGCPPLLSDIFFSFSYSFFGKMGQNNRLTTQPFSPASEKSPLYELESGEKLL